jgi:hypothetical protein
MKDLKETKMSLIILNYNKIYKIKTLLIINFIKH